MADRVICLGEVLIDFISEQKGKNLKETDSFRKFPGGAPANVCVGLSLLGVNSYFISKLSCDAFGEYLLDILKNYRVNTKYIAITKKYKTALSFVN